MLTGLKKANSLDESIRYLAENGKPAGETWDSLANYINNQYGQGLTGNSIRKRVSRAKSRTPLETEPTPSFDEGISISGSTEGRITSLEELLEKVDGDYSVEKVEISTWEQASKNEYGDIRFNTLHRVFARLKPVIADEKTPERILEKLKDHQWNKYDYPEGDPNGLVAELCLFDLHFGKVDYHLNRTVDYTKQLAKILFEFKRRIRTRGVKKILLPLGNDLFNIDNPSKTTTAGTPQSQVMSYSNMFEQASAAMMYVIDELSKIAPVEVLFIPGNHDTETVKIFQITMLIAFRNHENVDISANQDSRQYVEWGNNIIGYAHGDKVKKPHDLFALMANETQWKGANKVWHLGHIHQSKSDTYKGVQIEHIPSISVTDLWHFDAGFTSPNPKYALAFLWDDDYGIISTERIYE